MDEDKPGRAVRLGNNWEWQTEWQERRRPGLPVFGIFLILLGLFLALSAYVPQANVAGSIFFLGLGVVLLFVWLRDESHAALYLGAIVISLSLSDLLTGLNVVHGDGLGTTFLGVAFLLIALVRSARGGGWGWQIVVGVLLLLVGLPQVAATAFNNDLDKLTLPILIIVLGLLVITRARPLGSR